MAEFANALNAEAQQAKVRRLKAISNNLGRNLDEIFTHLASYEKLKAEIGADVADVTALSTHLAATAAAIKASIDARPANEQATMDTFLGLLGYVKQ